MDLTRVKAFHSSLDDKNFRSGKSPAEMSAAPWLCWCVRR